MVKTRENVYPKWTILLIITTHTYYLHCHKSHYRDGWAVCFPLFLVDIYLFRWIMFICDRSSVYQCTGLHFNKAYTHSGTSCLQCVYLLPSYFAQINIKNGAETLPFRSNVCKSGICMGSRKYLNEYTPYWSVSLRMYHVSCFILGSGREGIICVWV